MGPSSALPLNQPFQLKARGIVTTLQKRTTVSLQKSFATGQEVPAVHHNGLQHGLSRRKLLTHCTAQVVTQYHLQVSGARSETVSPRNGNGHVNGSTDKAITPPTFVKATGRVVAGTWLNGQLTWFCCTSLAALSVCIAPAGRLIAYMAALCLFARLWDLTDT